MSDHPPPRRRTVRWLLVAAGGVLAWGVLGGVTHPLSEDAVAARRTFTVVLRPVTIGPAELLLVLLLAVAVVAVIVAAVRIRRR